jgi:Cft2 family RNA processing exonuclease
MTSVGPLGLESTDDGLFLRALGLALDPTRPAGAAFVSHVHAAVPSARVYASPTTLALALPLGLDAGASPVPLDEATGLELPIDAAFGGGTAHLRIARAGHVLGASQLVIDHPRGRLVYTGDWSGERDATHEPGEAIACDELVLASTFGLPIFRFEPVARTMAALVRWCTERLAEGVRPVVVAQTPGPAQSIARSLAEAGLAVEAEDAVLRGCAAYEAVGCAVGPVRAAGTARDAVTLAAAGARTKTKGRSAIAYASGWALLDAAVEQKRADAAFALADQADFDALLGLVQATGATRIHVTRGEARAFARVLQARGLDARAIDLPAIDDRGAS